MVAFLIRRWFLLMLAVVLAAGSGFAEPLRPLAASHLLRQGLVAVVMFLMAFPLPAGAMGKVVRQPGAALLGSAVNMAIVPLLAWGLCVAIGLAWSDFSRDVRFGIFVAATVPCTLATATVWTRRAGGNDAVAMMVTLITNLFCFLITPAWLAVMIGRVPDFEPWEMVRQLALLVVLPMFAAQLLRLFGSLRAWATEHTTPIGVCAQCGVLIVILLGAIQTGNRLRGNTPTAVWANLAVMIPVVIAVHLIALVSALRLSRRLGLSRPDAIAVSFAGSQKTAMVGLEVSAQLGVTMLPMVAYHVGQLLTDTIIADRMRRTPAREGDAP